MQRWNLLNRKIKKLSDGEFVGNYFTEDQLNELLTIETPEIEETTVLRRSTRNRKSSPSKESRKYSPMRVVKATYSTEDLEGYLVFKDGDEIEIVEEVNEDYFWGKLENKEGYVPKLYVEELKKTSNGNDVLLIIDYDSVIFYTNIKEFKEKYHELENSESERYQAYKLVFPVIGGVIDIRRLYESFGDSDTTVEYEFLGSEKIDKVSLNNPIKFIYKINNNDEIGYVSNYRSNLKKVKYNDENYSVKRISPDTNQEFNIVI